MHIAFNSLFIKVLGKIHMYIHTRVYFVWDFDTSVRFLQIKKLKLPLKWAIVMKA